MNESLEDKLKELRKGYLKKLEDLLVGFKVLSNAEKIDIVELYSKVHTISGTSGMYGLQELSNISTDFEVYLKEVKENIDFLNQEELKKKLLGYIAGIEKLFQ